MEQFGLAEMKEGVLTPTPLFHTWFAGLEDAVYSLRQEEECLLIEWWEE
jgi:hypothetical protein